MSEPSRLGALLLGVIQGLTEFLPISSSGHLAAAQLLFPRLDHPGVTLEVAMHVGTTLAVLIYYRHLLADFARHPDDPGHTGLSAQRWLLLLAAGTIPTVLIGFGFREPIRAAFDSLEWIAGGLALTGAVLMASRLRPEASSRLDLARALLVGAVQGAAILPGVSRSGMTITVALLLGIPSRQAVTYSLLLSVPAVAGATVLDATQLVAESSSPALLFGNLAFATLSAGGVGYLCIGLVHRATRADWWHQFAWYCWSVALLLIVARP